MIRFTRVAKTYASGLPAIEDVSFHLTRGEFAFLTGPSGAGKSTVLKLCYVEERPSGGEVRLLGQSSVLLTARKIPTLRRRLGIVFQDFRLLPDRTAAENVAFALEVTGASAATIGPKVLRVLDKVGLKAKADSRPHELSGGEQQRVAIARALVNDPLLILADEPTGNLDERSTRGVFDLLQQINAGGTTVLMATHDLQLVRASGLRTLEMQRGRLVFDSGAGRAGTPAAGTEELA
ncbi:MAG: cell division ATP-binding protein FtsE [Gemmatimonadota bacterium]|nr:cell division ATP-binding protein FtsE [Gemmatimonadota bacterium]MDQ8147405.1 cell division ATP-binding protein FtsE [Gemmatimonadota bacterium]MDQ8149175.1 cell division ATP-binding protein FtsE [Gemmatimonadota bacterium]MDQ8155920.1 cell division ATP-binding protein FtsE [Gemmatimonadota bacterium]MDQ8176809.1 cell division ATP-binding protein FtsE [Gemmatimonadota bacterium]